MKPQSQIKALAELDGLELRTKQFEDRTGFQWFRNGLPIRQGGGLFGWGWVATATDADAFLPNYLGDLNAIRALVLKLGESADFQLRFLHELHNVCCLPGDMGWGQSTAGADKWCEVVLRAAGKWVEE